MSFVIDLPRRIDPALASDIEKESVFVSPELTSLRVDPECTKINVELSLSAEHTVVRGKVERFLDVMLKRVHEFDTKVFLNTERKDPGPLHSSIHAEVKQRRWLYDYGSGHVGLKGPALALAREIDSAAAKFYRQCYEVEEWHFPSLIRADLLARCGYFDSHPNAVCFVGHVIEDFDAIEEFRQANAAVEGAVLPPQRPRSGVGARD